MRRKQFRTSVLIDCDFPPFDDLDFINRKGLKPTNLLRKKIKELREIEEGAPTTEGLQKAIQNLQTQIQKLFSFIDKKGLFDEFIRLKDDINFN